MSNFRVPIQACCVTLAGWRCLSICGRWWKHLATGGKRNDGSAAIVPLVDHYQLWRNWPEQIPPAGGSYYVAAAARAGVTGELGARFAKTKMIIDSRP